MQLMVFTLFSEKFWICFCQEFIICIYLVGNTATSQPASGGCTQKQFKIALETRRWQWWWGWGSLKGETCWQLKQLRKACVKYDMLIKGCPLPHLPLSLSLALSGSQVKCINKCLMCMARGEVGWLPQPVGAHGACERWWWLWHCSVKRLKTGAQLRPPTVIYHLNWGQARQGHHQCTERKMCVW